MTQPLGGSKVYVSDTSLRELQSVTDELGHTTSYSYDSYVRPTQVTKPEGNYTQLAYDGRGNVTQATQVPKSGSGLSNIVTSANYDSTCTNPVKCNEPNYTIDAKGNQTDYTYDPTHGGVLTVTAPAPTTGAVRPQARYGYTALYAYYKNSSGTIVAAPTSVYKLTSTSACQTGSSCAGTSDEVKSTIVYGSTGVANNLLPTSVSKGSGDGSLTATTAAGYDIFGNLTSVDGPLSGTADTYGFTYDADRQLTLATSPDPDGAGPLPRRALRYTYNADGNVTKIERGTATAIAGPFTADPSGIREERTYDNLGRKITDSMASGTSTPVTNTLTQFSYDTKGRPNCSAVRMNPATFGSLPSDACTLGTAGTYGNDRISQIVYDNADEVTVLREAYGTSDQADERSLSYTNNGLLSTLRDGENNGTAYVYDGFDRLIETAYPVTTKGSGSANWSDNQQWTYDANSNVTSFRARSADTISYGYDNLNRLTSKTSSVIPGIAYTYDLLSRPLTTKFSSSGQGITNAFDALSRLTSSSSDVGGTAHALTYQYDLAGNRTRLTWWDGFYMAYDRLVTGDLSAVRENGAISGVGVLATFGYDNLGRRTSLTRGNGTSTSYSYDAVSRLSSLTQDLPGTAFDVTFGFSYNPANQIASETRSNDSYAYNAYANTNTNTTTNGLNQVTAAGSISATWDANGNLASYGTSTATHDAENKVISAVTVGTTRSFSYDPANRLDTYNPGGSASRFIYDGNEVAAELDTSGNILHRFVRGDGADEVLVDYSGSTNSSPQFLHADVRGSIIAWSDTASNAHINLYDEYGTPVSTNQGRFQYTGQMRLGEAGIYNYKARAMLYDIGAFLEPDPIGYADGPNWYVYAHDDPVNSADPSGLARSNMCNIGVGTRICQPDDAGNTGAPPSGFGTFGGGGADFGGGGVFQCIKNCNAPSQWINGNIVVTASQWGFVPFLNFGSGFGLPNLNEPVPDIRDPRCKAGQRATGIATASGYAGYAHEIFKGIAEAGGGGRAATLALGPTGWGLGAIGAFAGFTGSTRVGEPIDVAVAHAALPAIGGFAGGLGGGAVGSLGAGVAGSFVLPVLGTGGGLAAGAAVGGTGGAIGGDALGGYVANGYARLRGFGQCQ